jgi:DNA-binding transcriptional regulator YiaG
LKAVTKRRTRLGRLLEGSAKEILVHVKGEVKLPTRRIVLPGEVDVRRIRAKDRMSQAEFARAFFINPRTLQEAGAEKTGHYDTRVLGGYREKS